MRSGRGLFELGKWKRRCEIQAKKPHGRKKGYLSVPCGLNESSVGLYLNSFFSLHCLYQQFHDGFDFDGHVISCLKVAQLGEAVLTGGGQDIGPCPQDLVSLEGGVFESFCTHVAVLADTSTTAATDCMLAVRPHVDEFRGYVA